MSLYALISIIVWGQPDSFLISEGSVYICRASLAKKGESAWFVEAKILTEQYSGEGTIITKHAALG